MSAKQGRKYSLRKHHQFFANKSLSQLLLFIFELKIVPDCLNYKKKKITLDLWNIEWGRAKGKVSNAEAEGNTTGASPCFQSKSHLAIWDFQ